MKLLLANPRGFCAGVDRAIEIVERSLELFSAPIYVRHEVVHNRYVVDSLKAKGAIFVEELDEVPDGSTVIFSAHGVSKQVQQQGNKRDLRVFDATCPLVTKVHLQVAKHQQSERECILIGHAGHPEVEGTLGQYVSEKGGMYLVETVEDVLNLQVNNPDDLAFVTQTTLSVNDTLAVISALKVRFPKIIGPRKDDICYATQNRQDAVQSLAERCDLMLVVGSTNSSNSNRLRELSDNLGSKSYLIDNANDIQPEWLLGLETIGITAGASAPEILVSQVVARLQELGVNEIEEFQGRPEKVEFSLPATLKIESAMIMK